MRSLPSASLRAGSLGMTGLPLPEGEGWGEGQSYRTAPASHASESRHLAKTTLILTFSLREKETDVKERRF